MNMGAQVTAESETSKFIKSFHVWTKNGKAKQKHKNNKNTKEHQILILLYCMTASSREEQNTVSSSVTKAMVSQTI